MRALIAVLFLAGCGLQAAEPPPPKVDAREHVCPPGTRMETLETASGDVLGTCEADSAP